MVQTRRQWRAWADNGFLSSQESEECEECSQRSSNGSQSFDYNGDDPGPRHPDYSPNDRCKRHRRRDTHEYSEAVVAYRRRKPVR